MSNVKEWSLLRELDPHFIKKISDVFVFDKNAIFIITNNDCTYGFGLNKFGSIGLGHCNAVKVPEIINELCDKKVNKFAYNSYYNNALALTKTGHVYACGRNNYGQLADGSTYDYFKPKLIDSLCNVIEIRCGGDGYCLALTVNGRVYSWGNNYYGYLGIGNYNSPQTIPNQITALIDTKIVAIECGGSHSLALTDDGVVYGWGYNSFGQLGTGNSSLLYTLLARNYTHTPIRLEIANKIAIRKISCGPSHSLLLSTDGDIYAFGNNSYGQLGVKTNESKSVAVKVDIPVKFVDIAAFNITSISIAKSVNGYCYVWGDCGNKAFLIPKKTCYENINEIVIHFSRWKISYEKIGNGSQSVIYSRLTNLFNNSDNSDIAFKIDNQLIYAHKAYLKIVCKHFETMFAEKHCWSESSRTEIPITLYSYSVYYSFLKYLYTGFVEIRTEDAFELLDLANSYLEEELKQECAQIIKYKISIDNVCAIFTSAAKYDLTELKECCFRFAAKNFNLVKQTDGFKQTEDSGFLRELMIRVIKHR